MSNPGKRPSNQRLASERLRRYWSQQEVANRLGTTPENVSRWERGVTVPSPYYRQKLSDLFEKSSEELGLLPKSTEDVTFSDPSGPVETHATSPMPESQESSLSLATDSIASATLSSGFTVERSVSKSGFAQVVQLLSWKTPFRKSFLFLTLVPLILLMIIIAGIFGISQATSGMSTIRTPVTTNLATSKAVPLVYGGRGTLVLADSLTDGRSNSAWHTSNPEKKTGCHFINGVYDIQEMSQNYCLADNTNFANFIYEINMTIIHGETGGIIFRANDAQGTYYSLQLYIDGHYSFYRSDPTNQQPDSVIGTGLSTFIKQGHNQSNLVAVKAVGKDFFLYVNQHQMAHFVDTFYDQGNIGIYAGVDNRTGVSEVTYRAAKVWVL